MASMRAADNLLWKQRLVRSAALSILLVGIAPTQLRAQTSAWAGCYDLQIGPWSHSVGDDTLSYAPPPRIRLDSTDVKEGPPSDSTFYRVYPAPGSPPSIHEYASWRPISPDSLVIGWSTGFSGLSVHLARAGDLLRGRAGTFTDMLPYEPHTADVIARPVVCDAPMPPEHRSWRRFPREVPLEAGDTLMLGEPLPREDLALEHFRNNTYWVRHRPTGLFSGATHARVGHPEGIVRKIELFFEPETGWEALETRLASVLGPPTRRRIEQESASIFWSGREGHAFNLYQFTTSDGEERLVIMIAGS